MIAGRRRATRSAPRENERRPTPAGESGARTQITTNITDHNVQRNDSVRQAVRVSGCRSCGGPLALPWVMTCGGQVHLRCLTLADTPATSRRPADGRVAA